MQMVVIIEFLLHNITKVCILSAQHRHQTSVSVLPARMEAPAPTNNPHTAVAALQDSMEETAKMVQSNTIG